MDKSWLNVPNILSLSRIVFLPLLYIFVIFDMRLAFLITFIILGSTDYFDGLIARKFKVVSSVGKRLDSIADLFFYLSTAWFFYMLYAAYLMPNILFLVAFLGVLLVSFIVSTWRCKKPVMMHTQILRLNAVNVFMLVILSHFMNTTWYVMLILIIFIIGFIEEMLIFILYGQVDPDIRSIFLLIGKKRDAIS